MQLILAIIHVFLPIVETKKIRSGEKCHLPWKRRYICKIIKNNLGKHDHVNGDTILYVCLKEGRRDEARARIFLSGKLGEDTADYTHGFAFEFTKKKKMLNKSIEE